jgi:hypothetical protein
MCFIVFTSERAPRRGAGSKTKPGRPTSQTGPLTIVVPPGAPDVHRVPGTGLANGGARERFPNM